MNTLFVSAQGQDPGYWREAFADTRIVMPDQLAQALQTDDQLVWLIGDCQDLIDSPALAGRRCVAMSWQPDALAATEALARGFRGYCHCLAQTQVLQDIATVVQAGGLWLGPEVMQQTISAMRRHRRLQSAALEALTPRERIVAQGVLQGLCNKEIARQLDIEPRTVKAHMTAILRKLKVRDRVQLVVKLTTPR